MGKKYVKYNILPHNHFIAPKDEGTLWLLDGTRLQFAYRDDKTGYKTLIYYIVLDGKSKKIIGYSSSESENTEMAIRALKMACTNTKYLPREIIQDRSPAHRSEKYERIIAQGKLLGVYWRYCYSPTDNAYVERSFKILQDRFCKTIDGYLGDGIRSKDPLGKPAPEELKRNLNKKNFRTKKELEKELEKLIYDYNNSNFRINKEKRLNKEQLYRNVKIDPIHINSEIFASMFWDSKEITMHKGCIVFKIDGKTYYYNSYKTKSLVYFNQKVRVCYHLENLDVVFLFDLKTGKYIDYLERYIPRPKANIERSKEDKEYVIEESKKTRRRAKSLSDGVRKIKEDSRLQNEFLPPDIAYISSDQKTIVEGAEEKLTAKGILDNKVIERKKKNSLNDTSIDFEKIFKDMYKS